jgi:DNA modification methylase
VTAQQAVDLKNLQKLSCAVEMMREQLSAQLYNGYILGDAFEVGFPRLPEKSVDLVFTSVPDLHEVNITNEKEYQSFLSHCVDEFSRVIKPRGFVVLAQTDRRRCGHILPKHLILSNAMLEQGFLIKDHKVVIKQAVDTVNLFRLTYANLLVFTRRGTIPINKRRGEYLRDCWTCRYESYKGVWLWDDDFVITVITTLTQENDFVFDPFAGRGSVLRCCRRLGRRYLGVEKNPTLYSPDYVVGGRWNKVSRSNKP